MGFLFAAVSTGASRFANPSASPGGTIEKGTLIVENGKITALGPDVKDTGAGALRDQGARHVTGGHQPVIGVVGDAELAELLADRHARARGVGDEYHGAGGAAKAADRVDRGGKRGNAVVKNPPHVAKKRIVFPREFRKPVHPTHSVPSPSPGIGRPGREALGGRNRQPRRRPVPSI